MKRSTVALLLGILALSITACSDTSLSHKRQYFGYHNAVTVEQASSKKDTGVVLEENSGANYDTTAIISQPQPRTTVILSDVPDVIVVPVAVPWWDYYRYDWYVWDCYWWRPPRTVIIYSWYPWHPISWICSDWWYAPYWHSPHFWFAPYHHDPHTVLHSDFGHWSSPTFRPTVMHYDAEIAKDVPTVSRLIGHSTPAKGSVQNVPVTPKRSLLPTPAVEPATSIRSAILDVEARSGKRTAVLERSSAPPAVSTLSRKMVGAEKSKTAQEPILHRSGTPPSPAIEPKRVDSKPNIHNKPVLRRSTVPGSSRIPGAVGAEPPALKSRPSVSRPSSPNHWPAKRKLPKTSQSASTRSSLHRSSHPSQSSAALQSATIDRETAQPTVLRRSHKTIKSVDSRKAKIFAKSTRSAVHRQLQSTVKYSSSYRLSPLSIFSHSSTTLHRTASIHNRKHSKYPTSHHFSRKLKKRRH